MRSTIFSIRSYPESVPTPEPRPALAKAPDAELHPVSGKAVSAPVPAKIGKPGGANKLGKGVASDTLRGSAKDKLVDLDVRVPKSLRKRLRAEAKSRKVSPDEIVALLLDAALDERR